MATVSVKAIIERSSDGGYGIYCPQLDGISLFGYGLTEEEAKEDLKENLEMFIDECEDSLSLDKLNGGDVDFDYQYDISGFFKTFSFFNVTELAKKIGMHPSLLRRYKQGITLASLSQKQKFEKAIHELAKELCTVQF